jgi:PhoPQ-activated pathogenicity-related protein
MVNLVQLGANFLVQMTQQIHVTRRFEFAAVLHDETEKKLEMIPNDYFAISLNKIVHLLFTARNADSKHRLLVLVKETLEDDFILVQVLTNDEKLHRFVAQRMNVTDHSVHEL